MAYALGYIWADGSISKQSLTLGCARADEDLIISIRSDMQSTHAIHRRANLAGRGGGTWEMTSIGIYRQAIRRDLIEIHGLAENKTNKDLPWPTNIPDSLLGHFLRGVFDGDGCVTVCGNKGHESCYIKLCGTEKFLNGLVDNVARLAGVTRCKVTMHKKSKMLAVCQWGRLGDIKALQRFMYPEGDGYIFLKRKREKLESEATKFEVRNSRVVRSEGETQVIRAVLLNRYAKDGLAVIQRELRIPKGTLSRMAWQMGLTKKRISPAV